MPSPPPASNVAGCAHVATIAHGVAEGEQTFSSKTSTALRTILGVNAHNYAQCRFKYTSYLFYHSLPSLRSSWVHFSSDACNSPAFLFNLLSMSSAVRLAWSAVSCTLLTSASSSKAESFAMESWPVVCFTWSSRLETMFLSDITRVWSSFLSAST